MATKNEIRKSLRPRFSQAIRDFMRVRGIRSLNQMAEDFKVAGYPEPEKIYQQKLDNWINVREGVPDHFFFWLNKTYNLTEDEKAHLMRSHMYDVFFGLESGQ